MDSLESTVKGILLDIEGTTSSISFVHDEMFPFVRKHLEAFWLEQWNEDATERAIEMLAVDAGVDSAADWFTGATDLASQHAVVIQEVKRLMDGDVKATGLKQLQGLIWQAGFDSGQLVAHLWPEVAGILQMWKQQGFDLRIYSSGSIAAQKLFFGHSVGGDLLSLISGHYDTTIGGKKEVASYQSIAKDWELEPAWILFISDIPDELLAAKTAGFRTALSVRPGNARVPSDHGYASVTDFGQLKLTLG